MIERRIGAVDTLASSLVSSIVTPLPNGAFPINTQTSDHSRHRRRLSARDQATGSDGNDGPPSIRGTSNLFNGNLGGGTQLTATVSAGTYYLRVRGVNAAGVGAASNETVLTVTGCVLPATPTGLTFTRSGNVVTVMWNATPGAVEYFLEAGTAPGARNLYNGTVGTTTALTATVGPGTYYVRLIGANGCGASGASTELSIAVP